jgi:hypothetical protein
MKLVRPLSAAALAVAILAAGATWPSTAQAADCYALGLELAEKYGGQLARALPAVQDGKQVCRIVILVPGTDGERPRRAEYIVSAD